jgi:GNAT superfamily N-acetyltransferase
VREPKPYPRHWEADVVLSDGGTAHVRPIVPEDAEALRVFHTRLSKETVYNRFFAYRPQLSDSDVARFTQVDHDERVALVATLHDELIGVVRFDRLEGTGDAEVAFVVQDDHQGRGLGAVLLEHLAAAARERGVERFVADVLPTNRAMLTVFRSAGYEVSRDLAEGYVELAFPIRQTGTSLEVMRSREHRASRAPSTRSTRRPSTCPGSGRTATSPRSRTPSTWPSSPSRPRTWRTSCAPAGSSGSAGWWWCPAASPTPAPRGGPGWTRSCGWPGPAACG